MAEFLTPHSDDRLVGDLTYLLAVAPPLRPRTTRPSVCSFDDLEQRLREVSATLRRTDSVKPERAVQCALSGQDPLDYVSPTCADGNATCADVARLWLTHLGQRLAITTSGTYNRAQARSALTAFRETPALIRELTIRVEVGHISQIYVQHLAEDIRLVRRLWDLPALDVRGRGLSRQRLQIQVVHSAQSQNTARTVISNVLRAAGLSDKQWTDLLADPTRVVFRQNTSGLPMAPGHGIGVRGELFTVAVDGVTVHAMHDSTGQQRRWRSAVGLGGVTPRTGYVRKASADE